MEQSPCPYTDRIKNFHEIHTNIGHIKIMINIKKNNEIKINENKHRIKIIICDSLS